MTTGTSVPYSLVAITFSAAVQGIPACPDRCCCSGYCPVNGRRYRSFNDTFGGGNPRSTRHERCFQASRKRFEDRFDFMVGITAFEQVDVQCHTAVHAERVEEFRDEFRIECADFLFGKFRLEIQMRPPGQIEYDTRERLIHRDICRAVAL